MTWVGRSVRRREDEPLVRGAGRYLDDLDRPGQLHAAFVRSPCARAAIRGMAPPPQVLAARDIGPLAAPLAAGAAVLVTAADLAGTRPLPVQAPPGVWIADAAHPLLPANEVRYVGQPVALVLAQSRAAAVDAAALVDVDYEPFDAEPEVLLRFERTAGDVEGAFAAAAHVVRAGHAVPRAVAAPIEPRGILAEPSGTFWVSAQDTHRTRNALSHALGIEPRVVLPDVGGAFGSKGTPGPEVAAVAAAALRLGRPVKWVETRSENFLTAYQGRGMEAEVELALDGDGRMLAVRAHITADMGAYLYANSAAPPHTTAMLMCGCYTIPAASVRVTGLRTDRVPTGPCRGAGRPEAAAFLELTVDEAARTLGLDPRELRRRNLVRSFPHETPLGWSYDSGDYERCLDLATELVEPERGPLVGTGVALYVERAGGQFEEARVERSGGRVIAHTGAGPHGQGHATTFAQIVADALGVEPDVVDVRFDMPDGVGTFASRSTAMAGSALHLAALDLRAGGEGAARFESDLVFGSGAYAAVVEIDAETGALHVKRIAAVDDAGTIVNPLLAEGQVHGGAVHGLGTSLGEEVVHDEDDQPRNASFADYPLLTAGDVPEIRAAFVHSPSPRNPLGAKGIGEGGAIGVPAAIGNAIADALGGLVVSPPYTPEKLWRALRARSSTM